jgi:hydroxymethylpyrimidine/phosphomethylpyrimidine kinase
LTALTAQNTSNFESILPQSPASFRKQATLLLSDIKVDACKTGLIGSNLLIYEICEILREQGTIPVVVDPVMYAGTGNDLTSDEIISAMMEHLIPLSTVISPNLKEAYALTGKKSREAAAEELIQRGCQAVLITGADLSTAEVINTLHLKDDPVYEFKWERLPGHYHGSGCTLSATIAVLLSRKIELLNAIEQAQKYTWETLKYAKHYGNLQLHPDRSHRK